MLLLTLRKAVRSDSSFPRNRLLPSRYVQLSSPNRGQQRTLLLQSHRVDGLEVSALVSSHRGMQLGCSCSTPTADLVRLASTLLPRKQHTRRQNCVGFAYMYIQSQSASARLLERSSFQLLRGDHCLGLYHYRLLNPSRPDAEWHSLALRVPVLRAIASCLSTALRRSPTCVSCHPSHRTSESLVRESTSIVPFALLYVTQDCVRCCIWTFRQPSW